MVSSFVSMRDAEQVVLEYGPGGNIKEGSNCMVYDTGDAYVKITEDFPAEKVESYIEVLDGIGIAYPETEAWEQDISYYGIGETTVVEQEPAQPFEPRRAERPGRYVNEVRQLGLKAAANNVKLDMGVDNLAFVDGELGVVDVNDHEAIWTNEELALHLMGSHLLNSVEKKEKEEGLYAPGLKELGQNWKNAV